jgi:HD-GYP domain-containing protein (c-di-GMP phosphodiesterase class II)
MIFDFFTRSSLLARFTIVSSLVTIFIAAGLAWRLESTLEKDALWEVAWNTADQANNTLGKNLRADDLKHPLKGERYNEIDALIHNSLSSSNIIRIKIWNRGGLLIYSDDQSLVGNVFPISDELEQALNGKIATDISALEKEENLHERGQYDKLFEIYVPLQPVDSNSIAGAYEVYYDLAKLQPRLTRIRNVVWSAVGAGFLLLYGAVFVLVRNASRDLIQRNRQIQRLLISEQRERELSETLERMGRALSEILDLQKLLDLICCESAQLFKTDAAVLWLLDGGELVGFSAYGPRADKLIGLRFPIYDPQLLGARVARERRPILINDVPNSPNTNPDLAEQFQVKAIMGIPLIKGIRVLGSLMILDYNNPQRFTEADFKTASVFGSHAAVAIDNAQLFEEASLHLEHEKALREIDLAITSSLSLEKVLDVALSQTRSQLKVDACSILLTDSAFHMLEYRHGQGFETQTVNQTHIHLGEGPVGAAILQQRIYGQAEIATPARITDRFELIAAEGFKAYFIIPLVVKDKLVGALEIFNRLPLKINSEWLKFLETLAGQAAIAIDNATLLKNLQQSNIELRNAYEETIEGWSAALDLRDRETEGHTQRVTGMTLQLAKRMGFHEQELVHLKRGALLHDIGKMGVPDRILLKPESLNAEEWEIMQKHPVYAYQMLSPIAHLGPALDIPYCHHEKWDGTGYPRGLKGEEIPLAARIFAVADVYDALTSDRPYRAAWSKERALEYIRQLSGSHFDPRVAEAFLSMMNEMK